MSTAVVVATCAVVATASLYFLLVPDASVDLGTLTDNPRAAELMSRYYPVPEKQNMVQLSQGRTHYFLQGPTNGKKVVLVHGLLVTGSSFPQAVQRLCERGFQVLSYDLYGMGHSSSPGIAYTEEAYAIQLRDILDHVGWTCPVSVIAFSLGGSIASKFALTFGADRVEKLVLVAPAGFKTKIPAAGKFFEIPILGEVLFYIIGRGLLESRSKKHQKGRLPEPWKDHFMAHQILNIRYHPGFLRCYYKIVRYGPIRNMEPVYERVAEILGGRMLCVWGDEDTTAVYPEEADAFRYFLPHVKFITITPGGRTILGEKMDVADQIADFIL